MYPKVHITRVVVSSNSNICLECSPRMFGKMIQFDEHIFQMGWFNHELELITPPPNYVFFSFLLLFMYFFPGVYPKVGYDVQTPWEGIFTTNLLRVRYRLLFVVFFEWFKVCFFFLMLSWRGFYNESQTYTRSAKNRHGKLEKPRKSLWSISS